MFNEIIFVRFMACLTLWFTCLQTALADGTYVQIKGSDGASNMGTALLEDGPNGVAVMVSGGGFEPGEYSVHFHAKGKCEPPDFLSAGGHLTLKNKKHGFLAKGGPHAGDLGNFHVRREGIFYAYFYNPYISLKTGEKSIFDSDGASIVIYEGPDDLLTQPDGNAGRRIGCGVVTSHTHNSK